mmetsp:Transcript_69126/g.162632  ORF Transcript_69126/g.162632 Transcript_69126/m.162632 type:complete len:438 (+) Transcript_69126:81-1394(+)
MYAGPAIFLSFIFSGICCSFYGLCYAELAAMIPSSGSAYVYSKVAFGRFWSWVIGWNLLLEYLFAAATVAVGWSGYFTSLLKDMGIYLPAVIDGAPITLKDGELVATDSVINGPAVLIVLLLSTIVVLGIRESAFATNVLVVIKIVIILCFVGFGMWYIKEENLTPLVPDNTGEWGHFGWSGVLRGSSVIFFAYIGFDALTTVAGETENPQRNLPIGILGSLAIATVLYVAVSLTLVGIVDYHKLLVPDPVAVGVDSVDDLRWLRPFVKVGAVAGLSSVILVGLLSQARVLALMALDGLVPAVLANVHAQYKTPYVSTITTGVGCAFIAGLLPIHVLGELVSIGTLLAFLIVCCGVIALRRSEPEAERPFKVPFYPVVPGLGALLAAVQMLSLPASTWWRFVIWMILGMAVWWFYGRKNGDYVAISPEADAESKATQ